MTTVAGTTARISAVAAVLATGLLLAACARDVAVDGTAAAVTAAASGERHTVRPGETLSGIAERYGLGLSALGRANGIAPPYEVAAGRVLVIPDRLAAAADTYTVRPGDTLAGIASRHDLRLGDLVAANPGLDPDRVRAGQQVRLPGEVAMPAAPLMTDEEIDLVRKAGQAKPPSLSGDGFVWPVRGKVVSRFGEKPDGSRNDGVNIAAAAGTPVLAAENGVVVYAGDRLAGFGQTLLVRHAGGFTTAYAHNQRLLAKVGDRVRRGQRIAVVGSTGSVRQPQLHFELRAGRAPIDPQQYLDGDEGARRTEVASGG